MSRIAQLQRDAWAPMGAKMLPQTIVLVQQAEALRTKSMAKITEGEKSKRYFNNTFALKRELEIYVLVLRTIARSITPGKKL